MRIELSGTPDELREALKKLEPDVTYSAAHRPDAKSANEFFINHLKRLNRYSQSQAKWERIDSMNPSHMVNVMRKMSTKSATELLKDEIFLSLVVNLADKLRDGLQ